MFRSNGAASPPSPAFDLTQIRQMTATPTEVARELLADAGLELWQAPEGFWTVRLKQTPAVLAKPARRPRRPR
jgi:hypothetical protein